MQLWAASTEPGNTTRRAILPTPHSVTIKAVSNADKTLCHQLGGSAESHTGSCRTLSPTFLPVGNFTLTVGGANFVNGSKVIFGGTTLATTYVGPTQLTATGTTTAAQVGTVKITVENPDPGKSNSAASMNVQVGSAGQVSVLVIPATTEITAGSTFQYRAALNGAGANTAVKWAVNGIRRRQCDGRNDFSGWNLPGTGYRSGPQYHPGAGHQPGGHDRHLYGHGDDYQSGAGGDRRTADHDSSG